MKKKISLVVAVLVLVLGLAGCGNAKTVSYDKDTLIQSCDAVFDIIESGSITSDQITEMSDWNQGYLMAQFENQTGVQMEQTLLQLHWKDGKHPWKNAAIMKAIKTMNSRHLLQVLR